LVAVTILVFLAAVDAAFVLAQLERPPFHLAD
jgi:hypothetical protein